MVATMAVIPPEELQFLTLTVADAREQIRLGTVSIALLLMMEGVRRAEKIQDEGKEWGRALVEQWQAIYNRFYSAYGHPLE
jgi:hypothetical protein